MSASVERYMQPCISRRAVSVGDDESRAPDSALYESQAATRRSRSMRSRAPGPRSQTGAGP